MEQSENDKANESEDDFVPSEFADVLTPKQETFCREWIVDFNGTQAAIRAGYSEKSANVIASKLLAKANIKARVNELIEDRKAALAVTTDFVIRNLKEVLGRCKQEIRPLLNKKGDQVMDEDGNPLFVFDSRGANTALDLLGKHVGAFNKDTSGAGGGSNNTTIIFQPEFGDGKEVVEDEIPSAEIPKSPTEGESN